MGSLLKAKNVGVSFPLLGGFKYAVDGLDLSLEAGTITALVGESGCGKSVFAQTVMRLIEHTSKVFTKGEIVFDGLDLLGAPLKEVSRLRGRLISMIFQDPISSLHPLLTIGQQIIEPLVLHLGLSRAKAMVLAQELLERVGISQPQKRLKQYPFELSGGMCQRVMIAMAVCCKPKLLIADEPTTALDMTARGKVLDLIGEMRTFNMAVLLISHDLASVKKVSDKIAVMYLGHLVEEGSASEVLNNPSHPYTRALLMARPSMSGSKPETLPAIPGQAVRGKSACRFAPRCPLAKPKCESEAPPILGQNHKTRCFWPQEGAFKILT
ncbi:MAG: ABC transporter ATP-binding protein [Deltaproteobacteria bacterium]|jgi:peptide/nickel transport system ATP-binding protein|nr:ABC transporter ATP-binding protein [Deltaproteobacteria bacterium]